MALLLSSIFDAYFVVSFSQSFLSSDLATKNNIMEAKSFD